MSNLHVVSRGIEWFGELEDDRRFVRALARGLEVLRAFDSMNLLLGNKEISERTGLPPSSISRLTATLTALGYLRHHAPLNRYEISPSVLALGYVGVRDLKVRTVARPLVAELAEWGKVNVGLGVPDRDTMLYIEAHRAAGNLHHRLDVGSRIPMATTAMGLAYLAAVTEASRELLIGKLAKREPEVELRERVAQARESIANHGFCIACWQQDIIAAAVPLDSTSGEVSYVLNCGGPSFVIKRERLQKEIAPRLVGVAKHIQSLIPQG
jgi:DNA-binding IclR family transcriptional regulator